ncbi:zf-CCHC domain-containing protein [Tanacetum coccineum]
MGQFLKELRDNTFSGLEHEDANEHIEKVLEIVDLFYILIITQNQIMLRAFPVSLTGAASRWLKNEPAGSILTWEEVILFYNGPDVPTRQILNSKGAIPTKTAANVKVAIQEMAKYSQKWHNGTSRTRSTETFDRLAAIQAQLNSLGREIKKVNEKVYAAQFSAPYQPGGQYRAAELGFYQRNNRNSSYPNQRQTMEESLTKFMVESAKRHKENSNIIKEIRASTDAAIRNQGASIKTLEIQIGQMSKVLQERGFKSLHSSTETNPIDHVKSILTAKPDSTRTCCIGSALVDIGVSVSVMPFATYANLGLGDLAHTRLTVELADRTIKHPRGITENVLVRIGKFIFPIDFNILDIPKDYDVPLILGRPFLSTTHA